MNNRISEIIDSLLSEIAFDFETIQFAKQTVEERAATFLNIQMNLDRVKKLRQMERPN